MATAHDLSIYHRTDALLEMFTRLSDPSRCGSRLTVDNLRDAEDPSFQLRVATFDDSHVRSTQAPVGAAHVIINFGAHGRELISSEVALRLAKMLCGEAPSRFAGDAERSRERIAELLRHVVVKFVPVQVPSARRLAEVGGGSCKQRRLNARGVDVNRNWDVQWTAGDGGEGSSQYRGPRPFSEPETRALARYAEEWRPDVFVDVRSGDRYMAMPHAGKASGPADRSDRNGMRDAMRAVQGMLIKQHPKLMAVGDLPFGPASSLGEEPYRATGTALDYMYSKAGVRRSYMFEVYGASTVYGVGRRGAREIGRLPSAIVSLLQTVAPSNNSISNSSSATNSTSTGADSTDTDTSTSAAYSSSSAANSSNAVYSSTSAAANSTSAVHSSTSAAANSSSSAVYSSSSAAASSSSSAVYSSSSSAASSSVERHSSTTLSSPSSMNLTSQAAALPTRAMARSQADAYTRHIRRQIVRRMLGGAITPARLSMTAPRWLTATPTANPAATPTATLMTAPTAEGTMAEGPMTRAPPLVLLSTAEEIPKKLSPGMSAGLASEENLYDCVAFFNPTSRDEYETTVNGWADALLVLINSSLASAATRAVVG